MQYRYAQIYKSSDGFGYVECDSYLSGIVEKENMILLEIDFDFTNKRWNYETETWEDYIPEPEDIPEPQPSQLDRIEEMISKPIEQHKQDAVDEYTMSLLERGVLI